MALINELTNIGNAIREKTGGTELIPLKDMASAIQGISSGTEYTNIVYNEDNTVTLTDKDGVVHTMSCTYEDGKLISVNYDGEAVELTYNGDVLVNVGNTVVDMSNAPATSGGGAELNIAYGETAPEDTSKLWIKANEPENIAIAKDFEGVESIETVGNLPTATYGMGCARVANKVYLFGGRSDRSILNTISAFNLDTQKITILETTLPTATYSIGCVSVGTKIYLFGGNELNTINVFDTETETITTLSTVLPYSGDTFCARIENKVYLFRPTYNTIYVFDIETETITTLSTTLPNSCYYWISVGTKIYIFQGNGYNTIYVFNTKTQTISSLSVSLPVFHGYGHSGVCSVGTKIYLFGGSRSGGGAPYNTIYELDTETETIITLSTTLPIGCYSMDCADYGNKIYLFGGYKSAALNTINKFTITHDLAQNNIEIITDYKNFFNVINTDTMKVEIGINSVLIGNAENKAENCEAYLYQNGSWVQI